MKTDLFSSVATAEFSKFAGILSAPGFLRSRCRSVLCDPLGMVLGAWWAPYVLSDSFPLFPQEQNIPPGCHTASRWIQSGTRPAPHSPHHLQEKDPQCPWPAHHPGVGKEPGWTCSVTTCHQLLLSPEPQFPGQGDRQGGGQSWSTILSLDTLSPCLSVHHHEPVHTHDAGSLSPRGAGAPLQGCPPKQWSVVSLPSAVSLPLPPVPSPSPQRSR